MPWLNGDLQWLLKELKGLQNISSTKHPAGIFLSSPKIDPMKKASLKTIASKMKNLDFCMLITQDGRNTLHARPMSNNGQVTYNGTSWFFTYLNSNKVRQVKKNAGVSLIFQGDGMLMIECYGKASIVRDKAMMEEHWLDELNRWFPKGIETPGICLLKVEAQRVCFWDKKGEGEYRTQK